MKRLLLLIFIGYLAYPYLQQSGVIHVAVASPENQSRVLDAPIQKNLSGLSGIPFHRGSLKYMAEYDVTARVLSKKSYNDGKQSAIAPLDLALGWGRMAEPSIYRNIRVTQGDRFYKWWTAQYPIPRREIETSSVNMHVIPANEEVSRILKTIDKHDIVRLKGYLVHYREEDSRSWWEWKTSLVRTDTGAGACELMYVEQIGL